MKKEKTLAKVASILNENNVVWVVGGSYLLYVKKIVDSFGDFDILTTEDDIDNIIILMRAIDGFQSYASEEKPEDNYVLHIFLIDGFSFEFGVGFSKAYKGKIHYCPMEPNNISDSTLINGVRIPLDSLEAWMWYYLLLERKENVVSIVDFLLTRGEKMRSTHLGVYGIVRQGSKILLIKKAIGPYTGLFDLPGGGIEFGETPEQTLAREMKEETGLTVVNSSLSFCDSLCFEHDATSDRSTVELHHIGIFYDVKVENFDDIKTDPDGIDSDGAVWFDLDCDDKEKLAPFVRIALVNK